ncbi:Riboflavin synthase [bioreactor metagenome]|uniref:Riboflavin synthase n=1 Tax=bioreactor metagenome TaxID=1076179 RepID=A0A645FA22_9ZZZZ
MVPKGSIAIDGISLTVATLGEDFFTVSVIPTTWRETNLSCRKDGDILNLECDLLGKYVLSMLERMELKKTTSKITLETLQNAGFGTR